MNQVLYRGKVWYAIDTLEGMKLSRGHDVEILTQDEYDYALMRGDVKMLEKNKMIEIQEEVQIGDIILEKGDKIKVLQENMMYRAELNLTATEVDSNGDDTDNRDDEDEYFDIEASNIKSLLNQMSWSMGDIKHWKLDRNYGIVSSFLRKSGGVRPDKKDLSSKDLGLWKSGDINLWQYRVTAQIYKVGDFPMEDIELKNLGIK